MHGGINTADRYRECIDCGDPRGFDSIIKKCTITSCVNYFGMPLPPIVDNSERVYPRPRNRAEAAAVVDAVQRALPRPPSTRELVDAERAVLNVAIAWHAAGRDSWTYLEDLHGRVERLNALLARNSASNSDAFSRQHDR